MPRLIAESHQQDVGTSSAQTYAVPQDRIVSIEHPCIVRNFDNGMRSLGGEPQMRHALDHAVGDGLQNLEKPMEEPQLGLSLRPKDPFAKKTASTGVECRNVLVRVTLPKRTGRKRKRGTDDSFTEFDEPSKHNESITAPELLQRLRDIPDKTIIRAVGMIHETHRFRSLPDFQLIASENKTMRMLRDHTTKPHYDSLTGFHVDLTPGAAHIENFTAPPSFMTNAQPYRYEYTQAQGVKFAEDATTGEMTAQNVNKALRRVALSLPPDATEIPMGPPPELTRYSAHGNYVDRCVADLKILLEKRPLVTRRVAMNHLPNYSDTIFKEATQWVGYSFSAGPWRDTLIKYGVDPRSDPKYRFYQTLMFQLDKRYVNAYASSGKPGPAPIPKPAISNFNNIRGDGNTIAGTTANGAKWNRSVRHIPDSEESHIFNGSSATLNGKTWQILDITDPQLSAILGIEDLRDECDPYSFGWYHNGTLCKARVIMRDKMERLFTDLPPREEDWDKVASMPEKFDADEAPAPTPRSGPSADGWRRLAVDVRSLARVGYKMEKSRRNEEKAKRALGILGGKQGYLGRVAPVIGAEGGHSKDGEAGGGEETEKEPGNGIDVNSTAVAADAEVSPAADAAVPAAAEDQTMA